MFIEMDLQSEVPLYAQLVDQLIEGIASGALHPGDPLPSVRSLAADLGINLHTVNKAYTLLKQEGFLQVHRKQGVVVNAEGMPGVTEAFERKLDAQLKTLAAEAAVRGLSAEAFAEKCAGAYRSAITGGGESL
ncbi:GntR family transcriptional regulator [Cohnella lubricantis]|uniref:GntR family transcriptional regulator n=1 Tax=Cohnella lubricantis TaxID=2163172 RepID=A0A841T9H0_9BACL|nr:GntR family transcriptional regulator [Cohnella lubricantis]MBB6677602.1 GntR family transcriptional regulator [Cohnella lubricantis]MBP2116511.1 DNA-binding transcriptional regulator YhcF (GntR family) [Cohnella lubricantis]